MSIGIFHEKVHCISKLLSQCSNMNMVHLVSRILSFGLPWSFHQGGLACWVFSTFV